MNAIKLPFQFDVKKLQHAYNSIKRELYYEIHNTSVTPGTLHSIHLIEPCLDSNSGDFIPNDILINQPYLLDIYNTFECSMETFRIHTLAAGAHIKPHRDHGLNYENGSLRLHIPIKTNADVEMIIENDRFIMKEGECWYVNFGLKHAVENNSPSERVHLIIDCLANEWWEKIMSSYGKVRKGGTRKMSEREKTALKVQLKHLDPEIAATILNNLND